MGRKSRACLKPASQGSHSLSKLRRLALRRWLMLAPPLLILAGSAWSAIPAPPRRPPELTPAESPQTTPASTPQPAPASPAPPSTAPQSPARQNATPEQPPQRQPVDIEPEKLQPYNLPPASRQRMRLCGERWRDLKMAGKSEGLTWRSFAEKCLPGKD